MVEVFKTNITEVSVSKNVKKELLKQFPNSIINFDLEDCDRILRVENCIVKPELVIKILNNNGFKCEILE